MKTPSGSGSAVSRYWWYSSFNCAGGADLQSAGMMPLSMIGVREKAPTCPM